MLARFTKVLPKTDPTKHIKLVSYNILASCWAEPYPEDYTYVTDKKHLTWTYREPLPQKEILGMEPDICCLQEVEFTTWDKFKKPLEDAGAAKQKTANVILYKKRFSLLWEDHRSRAVIAGFNDASAGNKKVIIANVHLHGNPKEPEQRFFQTRSLLKQIRKGKNKFDKNEKAHTIITGDCNECPNCSVFKMLTTGKLENTFKDPDTDIVVTSKNYQHEFKFSSAYKDHLNAATFFEPPPRHYKIDYVYYSHDTLKSVALMEPYDSANDKAILDGLPNAQHPSDHVPIGAVLEYL